MSRAEADVSVTKVDTFFEIINALTKMLNLTDKDHVIAVAGILVTSSKKGRNLVSKKFDRITDAARLGADYVAFAKFDDWRAKKEGT